MAVCVILKESLRRSTVQFRTTYVRDLTVSFIGAFRNLLTVEGYRSLGEKERKSINYIIDFMSKFDNGQAVKVIKYFTAVYLPRLVGDVEPELPDFLDSTSILFTGVYGKFLDNRFRGRAGVDKVRHGRKSMNNNPSRRQISIAMSILQIKRFLPALPKDLKLEAKLGCKKRLTTKGSTPERLLAEIERTTRELFPLGWDGKHIPSYSVTNKSCLESTRSAGGAQEHMFKLGSNKFNQVQSFESNDVETWSNDAEVPVHPNFLGSKAYHKLATQSFPEQLCSKMEIVEDPLKARVITKNNWQCTVLKPLQKLMHNRLRKHPAFELIGTPITEEIVSRLERFPGSKYVSGDYEAATDLLHSDATQTSLDSILSNMTGPLAKDHDFMRLAKNSLTNLKICDEEVGDFIMERGQLMGSLLSFIILCVINFAVWRHATELTYGKKCTGDGSEKFDRVKINGDDIGFCATKKHYDTWKSLVVLVGLKPSLGKNYFCSEFITLNTRMFMYKDGGLKLVPFLNQGLLLPPGGDKGETRMDYLEALGPMHNDFIKGCSEKDTGSSVFISHHKEMLKKTWRNLFGSREVGGLGAIPPKESKRFNSSEGYSVRQLVIAKLLADGKFRIPSVGAFHSYDTYQRMYLKKRFPNVIESKVSDLPLLPCGSLWENVSELVDEASIDHKSMVSWLNPYNSCERDCWNSFKKVYLRADNYMLKGRINSISIQDYLSEREKTYIWKTIGSPSPCRESCLPNCPGC